MHDIICDLVMRITSLNNDGEEGLAFLVRAGVFQEDITIYDEEWEYAERISFLHSTKLCAET